MKQDENPLPYLLFTVGSNIYGISSEYVQNIQQLGKVTPVAGGQDNILGAMVYQNDFIYLISMRKLFGLPSRLDEFETTVQPEKRLEDHEKWLLALEKSVADRTEFLLTDDPHQCKLGKWYYSFHTDNGILKRQLSEIEKPHEAVHTTAKHVKELMRSGKYEEAEAIVKKLRNTHFRETIKIISSLRDIVSNSTKDMYVVLKHGENIKAIAVDSIEGIEPLEDTLKMAAALPYSGYVKFIGRRGKDNETVIVLNSWFVDNC